MNKIYITGCARSGTTLLARLMSSFDGVAIVKDECSIDQFIDYTDNIHYPDGAILVGKRTEYSIFSQVLSEDEIIRQTELIVDNDICIINCVRDGRFVVDSWLNAWGVYNPFAWMSSINQALSSQAIDLTVRYEEMVKTPDKVQEDIMEAFNLDPINSFSAYPNFVADDLFNTEDENYEPRPIDSNIPPPPDTYLKRPNDIEYFNNLLQKLGYEK